jgi:membrane-bound ClpP family serine protease
MSIGTGIGLFVIGAILAFAVNVDLGVVNLSLIGYILMGAGVVVFIIGLVMLTRRRQSVSTTRSAVDPASGEQVTRRSTESDDPIV